MNFKILNSMTPQSAHSQIKKLATKTTIYCKVKQGRSDRRKRKTGPETRVQEQPKAK